MKKPTKQKKDGRGRPSVEWYHIATLDDPKLLRKATTYLQARKFKSLKALLTKHCEEVTRLKRGPTNQIFLHVFKDATILAATPSNSKMQLLQRLPPLPSDNEKQGDVRIFQ